MVLVKPAHVKISVTQAERLGTPVTSLGAFTSVVDHGPAQRVFYCRGRAVTDSH